ncbi:hypothetical protein J2J97_32550 (plasmid) [Rhizobium bangladeshense]|uniref:hypothetical protein n=1 Tax=Rhizobium bangladeshense TaxID=1138189 RepID=UPI001A98FB29|nr:hypothetical protein [Rhizobium bangladeshense]QSY98636.1 hypothetical protein J2J97_32550 [Rhizobium bangladeshense]
MTTISPAPPGKWAVLRHSAGVWLARQAMFAWDFLAPWVAIVFIVTFYGVAYSHLDDGEDTFEGKVLSIGALIALLWLIDLIRAKAVARAKDAYATAITDMILGESETTITVTHTSTPELLQLKDAIPGFLEAHATLQKEVLELRAKVNVHGA